MRFVALALAALCNCSPKPSHVPASASAARAHAAQPSSRSLGARTSPRATTRLDGLPPVARVPASGVALEEVGYSLVRYRYFDGKSGQMAVGWSGTDEATGVAAEMMPPQDGKRGLLLHCPWRGGTGVSDQVYRLELPRDGTSTLRFSIALRASAAEPGKSDGVVFRVFADDRNLFERLKTDAHWEDVSLNLGAWQGKVVTLAFESDPGPARNSAFDHALWAERRIVTSGPPTADGEQWPWGPPPALATLESPVKSVAPSSHRETLEHPRWRLAIAHSADALGGLSADVATPNHPPSRFELTASARWSFARGDGSLVRSDSSEMQAHTDETAQSGGVHRTTEYTFGDRRVRVETDVRTARGGCAEIDVTSSDPYVAAIDLGPIGPVELRRAIAVPYYGEVQFLPRQSVFVNSIIDHHSSHASRVGGSVVYYDALTDGRRNPVNERFWYCVSPWIEEVLPNPDNPPSQYRELLADRVVLDAWDSRGDFRDRAARMRQLAQLGVERLLVLAHVWQHGGYDNELPDVLPARSQKGGDAGLSEWALAAKQAGYLFALHENYVDFYPNAPSFDARKVALDSKAQPIKAWFNESTHVQSLATAPSAMLNAATATTPRVHRRFGTTASFIDVNSATAPWFHVDFRSNAPGAGRFDYGVAQTTALWALMRKTHGGPVLGEGARHWYWAGLLDGVEAQFGLGWPDHEGPRAPLFVDFDLLKIHPLMVNHGMGYAERWTNSIALSQTERDQYRMQEIAFGHAGFIPNSLVDDDEHIWRETHLVAPVSSRYATSQVREVAYSVGREWLGASRALARRAPLDRVRIAYDNGLTIWANQRDEEWTIADANLVLPPFGWAARGTDVLAYTAKIDGAVVDYAETPQRIFAATRNHSTWVVFGKVATDGGIVLDRQAPGTYRLTPFRHDAAIAVGIVPAALGLNSPEVRALDVNGRVIRSLTLENSGVLRRFRLNTVPGARSYVVTERAKSPSTP